MKTKTSKELIILICLIPVLILSSFLISLREKNKPQNFSVLNKGSSGCSVFFETLKELKLPVEVVQKPLNSFNKDNIQLVVQNDNFDINKEEVKTWVSKGGVLIYLTSGDYSSIKYAKKPQKKGNMSIYKYNNGYIIVSEVEDIMNKTLTEKTDNAYELLKEINTHPHKNICFNEMYLKMPSESQSFWDAMPMSIKFIVYQIVLVLIAIFYFYGRRFGKPTPLYEEVERIENEYLYSAAAIYKKADCYDLIFENYYRNLLKQMRGYEEDWVEQWEQENLPELNKAKKVYKFVEHIKIGNKIKVKEYIQAISYIEELMVILKKRRDSYWKVLK